MVPLDGKLPRSQLFYVFKKKPAFRCMLILGGTRTVLLSSFHAWGLWRSGAPKDLLAFVPRQCLWSEATSGNEALQSPDALQHARVPTAPCLPQRSSHSEAWPSLSGAPPSIAARAREQLPHGPQVRRTCAAFRAVASIVKTGASDQSLWAY